MVKRIRGVAYSTRVSPQASNRMVDGARSVLNQVGVVLAGSERQRACHTAFDWRQGAGLPALEPGQLGLQLAHPLVS